MLGYPDRVTVTRPGEGAVDPDTGVYTATETTVLASACDVQSGQSKLDADERGQPRLLGTSTAWLPEPSEGGPSPAALAAVTTADTCAVVTSAGTRYARILAVDLFDRKLSLAWV